jgi:hypothetical protein
MGERGGRGSDGVDGRMLGGVRGRGEECQRWECKGRK